jgi:hypothetical protein
MITCSLPFVFGNIGFRWKITNIPVGAAGGVLVQKWGFSETRLIFSVVLPRDDHGFSSITVTLKNKTVLAYFFASYFLELISSLRVENRSCERR